MRCFVALALAAACGRYAFEPRTDGTTGDAPTASCTNAVRDGDERGIDCGGSCTLACPGDSCSLPEDCITDLCSNSVCELASGPPFWQSAPPLQVGRMIPAAARGGDGTLYVIGGADANNALASVEMLAVGATSFAPGPVLVTARWEHAAATLDDGSVYTVGGRTGSVSTPTFLSSLEQLAGTWQSRAPTPSPHASIAAAGGRDGNFYFADLDALWQYSPASDTWTTFPVTAMRDEIGLARGSDDMLYEVGGHTATVTALATVEAWSASTGWISRAPISVARSFPTVVAANDGRVYAVGGTDGTSNTVTLAEAYTPASDRWTTLPPIATRRRGAAGALGPDGRLYIAGGESFGGMPLTSVEAYGPVLSVASSGAAVTVTGRNFAASAQVGVVIDQTMILGATTDAAGAFAESFDLPSGMHEIVATDVRSQFPAIARVVVP